MAVNVFLDNVLFINDVLHQEYMNKIITRIRKHCSSFSHLQFEMIYGYLREKNEKQKTKQKETYLNEKDSFYGH